MSFAIGNAGFLLNTRMPSRHDGRGWKRRRLKPLTIHSYLNPTPSTFETLFQTLLSQFPSANALNYIAPTLGLASGLALYFSSNSSKLITYPYPKDIGEWILFASPTPFNRFVTLRCPSIYFPENELLENVNQKLVKEDRHYVKVESGRMIEQVNSDGEVGEDMYQRICVSTEDGGVVTLDWPANLDLEEERGLDTTVLIVPGTVEGSNEKKIRVFVCEFLRRGVFPVVMNPRGCARSPLTTARYGIRIGKKLQNLVIVPRLFSAADSDDISTAVQFINNKRPWTTLMGVGWGYGANMLTKYLAEFGERTPLTAATSIDNPFDLEETSRSSVHHKDFDRRHTSGLISILQCNKELFQGRGKGFDVKRALSASSIRDFEQSISMVSYGFDNIEDFYAKSSTRDVVGKVKIPLLFIQNYDGTIPLFSVPRGLIAENPYTSLLLCSYSSSCKTMDGSSTLSWCQNLTVEWLTAVELGLLKGRHPLLKDVDFTINPSKSLSLVENDTSSKVGRVDTPLNLTNGHSMYSSLDMFEANDVATGIQSRSTLDKRLPPKSKGLEEEDNGVGQQSSATIDAEIVEEGTNSFDSERGQVIQSAQVVINMLDITMPEILSDEQKKKVLSAVGQGETLIKALQDAVPEDVRGKLTNVVSGILQSQKSDLKIDKLLGHIPDVASRLNSEVLGKIRQSKPNGDEDVLESDQKKNNDPGDGSAKVYHSSDKPSGDVDPENELSENLIKPDDAGNVQSTSKHEIPSPDLEKLNLQDIEKSLKNEQLLKDSNSDVENVSEINSNQEISTHEGPAATKDIVVDQNKLERDSLRGQSDQMEENNQEHDLSTDQNKVSEAYHAEDQTSAPYPASETQMTENERESNQKEEEKGPEPVSSQDTEPPPNFNVSHALDALTGFDDTTQVAVNNVFHVIEGMIDQFEEEKDNENNKSEVNELNGVKELGEGSVSEHLKNNNKSEKARSPKSNISTESDSSDCIVLQDSSVSGNKHNSNSSVTSDTKNVISVMPAARELSAGNLAKKINSGSDKFPSYLTNFPYKDPLYTEYLKTYLHSKMRNAKPLDVDKTSALYLDYIQEEGQWKLLDEEAADSSASADYFTTCEGSHGEDQTGKQSRSKHTDNIIEPSYVVLDSGKPQEQNEELNEMNMMKNNFELSATKFDDSVPFIKSIVLECLNVEVGRRTNAADVEELELKLSRDVEHVANAVSLAAEHGKLHMFKGDVNLPDKIRTLDGENIIKAISSAVQETQYLKKVLPVGVVVGSTLAALRNFFNVAALDGNDAKELALNHVGNSGESIVQVSETETTGNKDKFGSLIGEDEDNRYLKNSKNSEVVVGAVTAALGASALFVHQQTTEANGTLNEHLKDKDNSKEPSKFEKMPESAQNNIVTSLAEKAMSVAGPVVPTKEDGGVDHERLVTMLAELGQKGGLLKLVGKVALLWGGIRGAMSLTDKLMSFLHIDERPLYQRILGFVFLVLLLWSPVIVPLLPSLMQSWATHNPLKVVEFAGIAGLYASIMIMVASWGKKVRKYDDPLLQYGLDLTSLPKFQSFLKGLVGGVILVILIHSVNSSLGCVHLCWPTTLSSSSSEPVLLIKMYGSMLMLVVRGIATATGVAVVEESFFRSWLPQEIAADLGYYQGIIISGFVFALFQRSMWQIPGLWLLSLSLAGARQRSKGSLSLPIGLRTGILASNFILKMGGFLTYEPNFPLWITGGHPLQPFSGVVGFAFTLVLAIILCPKQPFTGEKQPVPSDTKF
ncbi:hypothetical protein ACJIZ3_018873 [Penstemon smallii]|uniref:Uncharacterized protein n=1 Tax=Penstemon smallii TaxID=265156 RepID=A0ABD3T086_9LAMI